MAEPQIIYLSKVIETTSSVLCSSSVDWLDGYFLQKKVSQPGIKRQITWASVKSVAVAHLANGQSFFL